MKIRESFQKVENNIIINSIRTGLTMAMPVLLIGSMVIILNTFAKMLLGYFPSWIFLEGISYIAQIIYGATLSILSIYSVNFISLNYMRQFHDNNIPDYGGPLVATAGFIVLSGGFTEHFDIASLGFQGLFTAIFSAVVATALYRKLSRHSITKRFYTEGANLVFKNALSCIFPLVVIVVVFGIINLLLQSLLGVYSFQELFIKSSNLLFSHMGRSLASSMLFVFLSSVLWFFGIHGSNVLDNVSDSLFKPAIDINLQQLNAGLVPTEIFNKTFFDVFVFMGGCGSLMCLLIAVLLFGKGHNNRYLGKAAALPMLFNVNELLVFGFPVVFNPNLLIPFIATPLVCILTSTAAVQLGLVPVTVYSVEWTMPIIFNAYQATRSWTGVVLQAVNLFIGVMIYRPFLKSYELSQREQSKQNINELVSVLQKSEEDNVTLTLMEQTSSVGSVAKVVASDLERALAKKEINIFYQPQYNDEDKCIGGEALMRWNHSVYGMVYPPLVVKLADELGILTELEEYVFQTVANDIEIFEEKYNQSITFSINVSAKTIQDEQFEVFLEELLAEHRISKSEVCIEITEQTTLRIDQGMEERLNRIRERGFLLAIDDFSMGNTSLKYLKSNHFDIVKLDGSLVKDLMHNANSKEIINSIIYLSKSLDFDVVSEYVETEEIRDQLKSIGCKMYQGYFFQKAIPFDEFCKFTMER